MFNQEAFRKLGYILKFNFNEDENNLFKNEEIKSIYDLESTLTNGDIPHKYFKTGIIIQNIYNRKDWVFLNYSFYYMPFEKLLVTKLDTKKMVNLMNMANKELESEFFLLIEAITEMFVEENPWYDDWILIKDNLKIGSSEEHEVQKQLCSLYQQHLKYANLNLTDEKEYQLMPIHLLNIYFKNYNKENDVTNNNIEDYSVFTLNEKSVILNLKPFKNTYTEILQIIYDTSPTNINKTLMSFDAFYSLMFSAYGGNVIEGIPIKINEYPFWLSLKLKNSAYYFDFRFYINNDKSNFEYIELPINSLNTYEQVKNFLEENKLQILLNKPL